MQGEMAQCIPARQLRQPELCFGLCRARHGLVTRDLNFK